MVIKVYRIDGRLVEERRLNRGDEVSLLSGHPKGVYFVVGKSVGETKVKKVLLLR